MKKNWFNYVLILFALIMSACIFLLPETVPVHWNVHGEIDGYGSRLLYVVISVLPLIIYYGMDFTKKIDPKYENIKKKEDIYELFKYFLTVLFMVLAVVMYLLAMDAIKVNASILISVIMGSMFVVMGNYMPKVPQNYFLGIRTPWAIENEIVWKKTHRMGGHLFVLCGICICVSAFISSSMMVVMVLISSVGLSIGLYAYSYLVYKKLRKEE